MQVFNFIHIKVANELNERLSTYLLIIGYGSDNLNDFIVHCCINIMIC